MLLNYILSYNGCEKGSSVENLCLLVEIKLNL